MSERGNRLAQRSTKKMPDCGAGGSQGGCRGEIPGNRSQPPLFTAHLRPSNSPPPLHSNVDDLISFCVIDEEERQRVEEVVEEAVREAGGWKGTGWRRNRLCECVGWGGACGREHMRPRTCASEL